MTTHGKNDMRYDDLLVKARELGTAAGKGKDTLVQFGILMVNAAYDGVLDLMKDKHQPGIDDAVHAYTEYSRAMTGATIFDHRSPSGKVQAAKLRSCIKLGKWTRGGPGEPIASMNKLFAERDRLRRNPGTAKQLDDAYNTLLRYARYQVKQNAAVDDVPTLKALCVKPVTQAKTLEEYIGGVVKTLEDLQVGRAAHGTLLDNSPAIQAALAGLRQHTTDLRKGEEAVDEESDHEQELAGIKSVAGRI